MRSAASFLILVIYCLSIGAYDALAYEADEKAVRKLLTLEDPSKNWQLKKAARKFLRGLSKQQARATLESVVKSGKCSQAGKVEYLHLADGLGASTTFWDTALDIVRNGNTKLQQKAMSAISNYLGRNKSAHADRRKSMIAALWALLKNEQMEQKSKILGVLMRLDSKQATAHLLQGFGAQKWPENERYGMVSMLRSSTGVPRKRKLEILKGEMNAGLSMMYRRSVRNQLDRLIGNETADRLFDAATPPPKSPAKVDKKFRGLSQAQLRRTKVSFEFVDVPVDWGVDWFQRSMGMDIRWNSSVDRILFLGYYGSVQAQDLRSLQALARVLLFAGLAPKVERGHIRIIAGTIRDTTTAAQKKRLRTILAKRISLEPKSSNLPGVLNLLSSLTGLPVVLDPNVAAEARKIKINEKFTKVPCSSALRRILKISSMKWRYMHGMIQVYK